MPSKAPPFAPVPAPIPKVSVVLPSYRLHKASGKAVVTLGGRDVYLGDHGSPESQAEYRRVLAEWLVSGQAGSVHSAGAENDLAIVQLMAAFWRHAERAYPAKSLQTIRQALASLRSMYGHTKVRDFRPLCIRAIQQSLIDAVDEKGNKVYCRRTINHYCAEVRHVFKWGVGEGLVPPAVWHGLQAVGGLRRGRSEARESEPIRPVCDADVEAALAHVTPVIADMVRVQRFTGARPSEVCKMTVGEIDTTGSVWMYVPREHKTAHHGKSRVICIGPRAQAVLRGYLRPDLAASLFSPRESELLRKAAMREARKSPMTPSQRKRDAARARRPKQKYRTFYGVDEYRRAIWRGCDAAGVPRWSPNQLRHTRATEIRKSHGLDAAGAVLGHSLLETTQTYAERSTQLAAEVALKTG